MLGRLVSSLIRLRVASFQDGGLLESPAVPVLDDDQSHLQLFSQDSFHRTSHGNPCFTGAHQKHSSIGKRVGSIGHEQPVIFSIEEP